MAVEVPFLEDTDETPLNGVSDFRGRRVYHSTTGGWRSALFVAVVEIAGSFANFGVSANLITYLTGPLGHSNAAAAAAVNAWSGTCTLMPLLGAFVADSWLGRYRSLVLACSLYVLGYGMITLASMLPALHTSSLNDHYLSSHPSSTKVVFFYASLYVIALAQGGDKPCGLAFAADQFDPDHPKESVARGSLFNWWYFFMACGITIAVATVSYIQENVGWEIGFGALCIIMLCAFVLFLIGTPTYRLYALSNVESPFFHLARGLIAYARNSSYSLVTKRHQEGDEDVIDKSKEARGVLQLLKIWLTCLAYGVVSAQVTTLFNKQGRTLDRHTFGGLELPQATLLMFGPATILVFVPIYDRVFVPVIRRATGNPSGLTLLQRVGTGMALSMAAVSVAALVEYKRLEMARERDLVDDASSTVPMSWTWIVPQYVILGVANVFATVGLQEFFYDQMPDTLRSVGLALYLSVMGIGSLISGILVSLIDRVTKSSGADSWFADNLNHAHLDYFYWLLAGVSAVELALYLYLARSYVYVHKGLH